MVKKLLISSILLTLSSVALATNPSSNDTTQTVVQTTKVGVGVDNDNLNVNKNSNNNYSKSNSAAVSGSKSNAVAKGGNADSKSVSGVVGSGNSKAVGVGIAGGNFGGTSTASQGQTQNQVSTSSADNSGNNTGSGNTTVVEGDSTVYKARRIPVATAVSTGALVASQGTCLGSAGVGAQAPLFGVSISSTKSDPGCELARDVAILRQFGGTQFEQAACFRARATKSGKQIDLAMKAAGIDCAKIVAVSIPVVEDSTFVTAPIDTTQFVTREELKEREDRMLKKSLAK